MQTRTLAGWMEPQAVDFDLLEREYAPLLGLVKNLLGVVPNCDRYLEIWPVGFRTYNLMVPNFLNLPQMLIGLGAPKDLVGLALYASSRASECPYCSAHCCSFAIRRGAKPAAMMGDATPVQQAVLDIAGALGSMPDGLSIEQLTNLQKRLKPAQAEWIIMGIAMMGFLNKFMDAMGIPLESEAVADSHAVMSPTGWLPGVHYTSNLPQPVRPPVDGLRLYRSLFSLAPGALRFDHKWLNGIPRQREPARRWLLETRGVDFAVLDRMELKRPRRALTAMLRDNLDSQTTELGLRTKALGGLVFAELAGNRHRRDDALALIKSSGAAADQNLKAAIKKLALGDALESDQMIQSSLENLVKSGLSSIDAAVCVVARAVSPSPAEITPAIIELAGKELSPEQCVELVTWLSIQQLLHRLDVYYDFKKEHKGI